MSGASSILNVFEGNVTLPQEIECPDCQRTFMLVTALEVRNMRAAGDRCPTCQFNFHLKPFLPEKVYERFKRRIRVFHVDDPRHPEYRKTHPE